MSVGVIRIPPPHIEPHGAAELHRVRDSAATKELLVEHDARTVDRLGLEGPSPFMLTEPVLAARKFHLDESRAAVYTKTRGVMEIGKLVGATVKQMEVEFERTRMLDVGCGLGRLGLELARNAKTKTVFIDRNVAVLPILRPRDGQRMVTDAVSLPVRDEAFPKTVSAYSSLIWSEQPVDTLTSLLEGLRVTTTGGTFFAIPFSMQIMDRMKAVGKRPGGSEKVDHMGMDAWDLQDHFLLRTLRELEDDGYCRITWTSFIGNGVATGKQIENYSAIIDKLAPIPEEVREEHLAYAHRFMPNPTDEETV